MKLRNVVWPVVIVGAFSLAGACSGGDGGSVGGGATGGDAADGGSDGNGTAGTSKGGSKNTSGAPSGGASDGGVGGEAIVEGGATVGGASGGAGPDLCADKDLNCEDDGNPCTEDECNPATGECGIPRTGTSCDDGMFCNGDDTCSEGECTDHAGNDCSGACNEAGDYCECSTKDDCPADEVGEWDGECQYASECVETGARSRIVTKYTCNEVGKCVGAATVENDNCPRETDGNVCTSDNLVCNGSEKCKAGNCVGDGVNPCKGNASAPYCYDSGTQCRMCQAGGSAGNPAPGCTDASPVCCYGTTCQSGSLCKIQTSLPPVVGQIVIDGLQ